MNKVALVRCESYEDKGVLKAVREAIDLVGGISSFVKPRMTVALKPNLITRKNPEDGATTHPSVVRALMILVKEAGGRPVITESPGGLFNRIVLKAIYSGCGMEKIAEETAGGLNYNVNRVEEKTPQGKYLKSVVYMEAIKEADLIINIPKLKTHGQMVYTGAVKNMFGAVPGEFKAEYHFRMSEYDKFADALIDIFLGVKPALNVMDGIYAMEGEGPTAGRPRKVGAILAGTDAFSLDLTALDIIGVNPLMVPILAQGNKRGLCSLDMGDLILSGDDLEGFKIKDFDVPGLEGLKSVYFYENTPLGAITKRLKPKPEFDYDLCTGCGICAGICPAKVIQMVENRPRVDLKKCINCFCCQELCPNGAVRIRRSPLFNILQGKRKR